MNGIEKSESLGNWIMVHLAKHAINLKHCAWDTAQVTIKRIREYNWNFLKHDGHPQLLVCAASDLTPKLSAANQLKEVLRKNVRKKCNSYSFHLNR